MVCSESFLLLPCPLTSTRPGLLCYCPDAAWACAFVQEENMRLPTEALCHLYASPLNVCRHPNPRTTTGTAWGRSTRQVVEVAACRRTLRRSALTGQASRPTVVWEASGGRVLHWTATTHIRLHYAVHNVVCIFRLEANPPSSIISRWMTNSRKEQHTY
jgi:hypothetical protein